MSVGLALATGCSDDPKPSPDVMDDAADATVDPDDAATDMTEDGADTTLPNEHDRVIVDLDTTFAAPGSGFVRARQTTTEADLIPGEVAQGLTGDYLLENAFGRYLVGFGKRAIGPCSWDGNPIETEARVGEAGTGSALGEICFLLNVGQTVAPEHIEILEDGSSGRATIAVTGRVVPLDFLNLSSMLNSFAPGIADLLDFDPERPLPFRVTFYYVLTPESRSLRVLTAVRNDGDDDEYFLAVQLVLSGSTGSYFTPLGAKKGWGYNTLGADSLSGDPVSFLGYFARDAGYAVVPDPDPAMAYPLPVGAGMLAISGAAALVYGATDVVGLLLAPQDEWPTTQGMQKVPLGGVYTVGYRLYPADGSVSSAADVIYADLAVPTTGVSGRVVDHAGAPKAGVRVTALGADDHAYNMAWSGADGSFTMHVPSGTYSLRLRDGDVPTTVTGVVATEATLALGDVALVEPGMLKVAVTSADGAPTPARVVIACAEACPEIAWNSNERDGQFTPPNGWLRLIELGVDGMATIPLPAGSYKISVNRGMTWSTWPADATDNGGTLVTVIAGETAAVNAEIAKVVDTTGALGADFHVHAMASPDSQVADRDRVLDLMAGGLDVMVSTDHDAIIDFAPTIAALDAGTQIRSIIGSEITSAGFGHINAFPLEVDTTARRGGPFDWSGGGVYHLTVQELIDEVRAKPGDKVVQLNHPSSPMGAIGLLGVDALTGQSFTDPVSLRMAPTTADPVTGDTGLWSEEFDAMELYNGFSNDDFWSYFRWWLAMVGRGFTPTGTAVTDTHNIYGSLGASPRSFVFVEAGQDRPSLIEVDHLVNRIKHGAVVGTNGPFMRVEVANTNGERAALGDVLDVSDGSASLKVTLEMPTWIDVDTVDVYVNVPGEGLIGAPGAAVKEPLAATISLPVVWTEEHRQLAAEGAAQHYRLRQVLDIPLTVTADSYVVVRAHAQKSRSMQLVVGSSPEPMAFSNPVFLDFDGGGYDKFPLMTLRAARRAGNYDKAAFAASMEAARKAKIIIPRGKYPTPSDLIRLFDAMRCKHDRAGATPHHHDHGRDGEFPSDHGHSH